jgi:hypothetical protein
MADVMNHTYRELMNIQQMGFYEVGFDIVRHGFIKAHNGTWQGQGKSHLQPLR